MTATTASTRSMRCARLPEYEGLTLAEITLAVFEPLGALHTTFGSASPDASARAVAILRVPTGIQRLVTSATAN